MKIYEGCKAVDPCEKLDEQQCKATPGCEVLPGVCPALACPVTQDGGPSCPPCNPGYGGCVSIQPPPPPPPPTDCTRLDEVSCRLNLDCAPTYHTVAVDPGPNNPGCGGLLSIYDGCDTLHRLTCDQQPPPPAPQPGTPPSGK
jgi:hypothetical protein